MIYHGLNTLDMYVECEYIGTMRLHMSCGFGDGSFISLFLAFVSLDVSTVNCIFCDIMIIILKSFLILLPISHGLILQRVVIR